MFIISFNSLSYEFQTLFGGKTDLVFILHQDFYTAWDVIAKHVLDYRMNAVLAYR